MTIHQPSIPNWDNDVLKAAQEVDALFPRRDWTSTYPGHGENSAKGAYAVDFMVSNQQIGDLIADYVWKNRKRLGVRYVIWWGRIISETHPTQPNVWLPYFNRNAVNADGTPNESKRHTNHVHVSFYVNAIFRPLVILTERISKILAVRVAGYNFNWPTHVRVIQIALRELGYDPGPIDSKKGERTIGAMNQLLAANGWPKASGKYVNLEQLRLIIRRAEALEEGDQYPPAEV